MAISKKINNKGTMANPGGVSKIDLRSQIAEANRELMSNYKGHSSACKCGENFRLNDTDFTLEESAILDKWLSKNGCQFCDWKNPKIFRLRKLLLEVEFQIGAKKYEALRVPVGYYPRKVSAFDAKTQCVPTSKVSKGIKIYSYDSKGNIIDLN